mmetsp:Transcript_21652/g.47568  ORF Transcript_21652/g.47568 Transcript_21652/m.47568 type:complete len:273 (-) Transcript_21652:850-1668(-)
METPWSLPQSSGGSPLEGSGNRNGTTSPSVSYLMSNATTQHNHHTKRRRRRSKHGGVRVADSLAATKMHPEITVADGAITKRPPQPRNKLKTRNRTSRGAQRKGGAPWHKGTWRLQRISAPQNSTSFIMSKTPNGVSAFISPNHGSLSIMVTPSTAGVGGDVDNTATLPTLDCFGSMQGLIIPARHSGDDETSSSEQEDRVKGFLLVKEDETTAGHDRDLKAQLTKQSSYISTLEEDNQKLRERIRRLENELRAVAQQAVPQMEETDGETNL